MTINDIAALAGVSISTVSKIINNKDKDINKNTRERVLKIIKENNYKPYAKIKSKLLTKTFILGVILKESGKPNLFLNGILSIAQQKGYSIMIYTSSMNHNIELNNINSLIQNNVDGVIWENIDETSLIHSELFEKNNIHLITINNFNLKDSYFINFFDIAYKSTKFLIDYGHKNITCLIRTNSMRSDSFILGFKKALADNKIDFNKNMIMEVDNPLLKTKILSHKISAIISAHEQLGADISEFITKINYKIPKDISILTLWDDASKRSLNPNYAGIKLPYLEFGEFVCKKIISKCENNELFNENFKFEYFIENINNIGKPYSKDNKKILIIGSINIDTTLTIDELPKFGQTVITDKVLINLGGRGANETIAISKLDYPACLIGKVGDDFDSSLVYSCMQDNNIDISSIIREKNNSTGKAYIQLGNDGESLITVLAGANTCLSQNDIYNFEHLFENTSYCLMQTEVPKESLLIAAKLAHKYKAKTILKPATLSTIDSNLMKETDIFIPNLTEAINLSKQNMSVEEMAAYFCALGTKTCIITMAKNGAYIYSDTFKGYIGKNNFIAVDSTGGSDAFIACLATYLSLGYDIEKASKIANIYAGFCISKYGTTTAFVKKEVLEDYINKIDNTLLKKI